MSVLEALAVSKHFGGIRAVDDVSIAVEAGTIASLIGPNGAGKTTLFDCLTGLTEPDEGRVLLDGADITRMPTHDRARRGMGRTFQRLEVFSGLTVRENLCVAAEAMRRGAVVREIFRLRHTADPAVANLVDRVLDELDIAWAADRVAGDLPTGVLRIVELGRAGFARPPGMLVVALTRGLGLRAPRASCCWTRSRAAWIPRKRSTWAACSRRLLNREWRFCSSSTT